jgi:nitroreductase
MEILQGRRIFMNAIFERRSVRKYEDRAVPPEMIDEMLRAGMAAPSAGNERPWQFVVTENKEILKKLADDHPYGKMLARCPAAVAVCADLSLDKYEGAFWPLDCSAATENILVCAAHLGLGAVGLGVDPRKERMNFIGKTLELPEGIVPFALIAMGYPDEKPAASDRFDPARIHRDKW